MVFIKNPIQLINEMKQRVTCYDIYLDIDPVWNYKIILIVLLCYLIKI